MMVRVWASSQHSDTEPPAVVPVPGLGRVLIDPRASGAVIGSDDDTDAVRVDVVEFDGLAYWSAYQIAS